MSKSKSSSNSLGFTGALFLVFLVLKLTHVIDWSWWWITCPLWGGVAIAIFAVGGYLLLDLFFDFDANIKDKSTITQKEDVSKFMQKLRAAEQASEERRKAKLN